MSARGRAYLAGVVLCVFFPVSHADISNAALEAYRQEHWLAAIELLKPQTAEPGAMRMLGLAYYNALAYENALDTLREASKLDDRDIDLHTALLDLLLAGGHFDEAGAVAEHLKTLGGVDEATLGSARIQLTKRDQRSAGKARLHDLVRQADRELSSRAADILIEALYEDGELRLAYEVARTAIAKEPDGPLAYRFSHIRPPDPAEPRISIDLGYRFEYDDNVTFPDEVFASNEDDYRHVLMADVRYESPLGNAWGYYAQGHLYQSFHHDLDRFDQTRISGAFGIGQTGLNMGWRFPVEITHDRLDGDSFSTSVATLPGFFFQFGAGFESHVYVRLQSDDFEDFAIPEEDRSGDVTGAGIMVTGKIPSGLSLHGYLEFNEYDTDGAYWQRDELVAFLYGEYEISEQWAAGLALRYQDEDYDNARPVFANRQDDESTEIYLNLTHTFHELWRWRGQVSLVDHESNIPIFDYDRNVYSFSVTREF